MHKNELPQDLLAEKSLIGCLILDGRTFDEISDLGIEKPDFHHPQYGIIFDTIKDLCLEHLPVDYVTLCNRLSNNKLLDTLGEEDFRGRAYITQIIEDQISTANVYYYAQIVKEKSILRNVITTAYKVAEDGKKYQGNTKDFLYEVESKFFKMTGQVKSGGLKKLMSCLKENLISLETSGQAVGEIAGIPTGFVDLDKKLLGLQSGQLVIVAARPGMGKTSFAINIGIYIAKTMELPILVFSLEMLAPELSMRILASEAKIDSRRLKTKDFNDSDLRKMAKTVKDMDILSEGRKITAEHGLGMVIVDYVQLMRSVSNNPSREQQISEISRSLKQMAKELDCPVMALSQLNRAVESRTDKRPMVSDLRESGSLEQDADIVMLIYRDEVYHKETKEPGVAEIILGKNRSGETGSVKLKWFGEYTTFANLTQNGN